MTYREKYSNAVITEAQQIVSEVVFFKGAPPAEKRHRFLDSLKASGITSLAQLFDRMPGASELFANGLTNHIPSGSEPDLSGNGEDQLEALENAIDKYSEEYLIDYVDQSVLDHIQTSLDRSATRRDLAA